MDLILRSVNMCKGAHGSLHGPDPSADKLMDEAQGPGPTRPALHFSLPSPFIYIHISLLPNNNSFLFFSVSLFFHLTQMPFFVMPHYPYISFANYSSSSLNSLFVIGCLLFICPSFCLSFSRLDLVSF